MSFFVRRTNIARATLLLYASYASHVPIASNILSFSSANGIVFFCQVNKLVMEFVEEARKVLLPVTRATIQSLGVAARDELSAVVLTSADDKNNLEMFGASEKLVRNFLLRHGMSSTVLHGEAGSVDVESVAEGMEMIRLACLAYYLGKHLQRRRDGHLLQAAANAHVPVNSREPEDVEGYEGDEGENRVSAYM